METSSPAPSSSYKYSPKLSEFKDVPITKSPSRYSPYTSASASDFAAERLNSIRSRLSLGNSGTVYRIV